MAVAPSKLSAPIDLALVRRLFGRSERIARSAFLRREIAERMLERLALVKVQPTQVLDAGCGAGEDLPVLEKRFPAAQIIGLDAAPAMLAQAKAPSSRIASLLGKLMP